MKVRMIITLSALAAALVVASGANGRALTLSQMGYPGPWVASGGGAYDIYCMGAALMYRPPHDRVIQLHDQTVGRSARYPHHLQDVFMQVQLQWSTDARSWYVYDKPRPWKLVAAVRPGYDAVFSGEQFNVSPYPGLFWRVRVEFRWFFAGTNTFIGQVVDSFTPDGIRTQYNALSFRHNVTGEAVCRLD